VIHSLSYVLGLSALAFLLSGAQIVDLFGMSHIKYVEKTLYAENLPLEFLLCWCFCPAHLVGHC
jgi:hypothetical protein